MQSNWGDSQPGETQPADAPAPVAAKPRTAGQQLSYVLSLPERAVRTGTGLIGGVIRESASLLVPQAFQSSRTYTVMVRQTLDLLVHDVGGVAQGDKPSSIAGVDNYVARKAIGNFIDLAALATLHISPLMILAAVSDVAYGSQVYLKELADELKAQGIIAADSKVDHINDLLTAVSEASKSTGDAFNTPPLSVEGLRATIEDAKAVVATARGADLLPQAEVARLWEEMREIADRENVGLLAVSGAATMHALGKVATVGRGALSGVKVAGSLLDRHVIDHYSNALGDIRSKGLYQSLSETSEPYIAAVWENFRPHKSTITEGVVSGRLIGTVWRTVRQAFSRKGKDSAGTTNAANAPDPIAPTEPVQADNGQV